MGIEIALLVTIVLLQIFILFSVIMVVRKKDGTTAEAVDRALRMAEERERKRKPEPAPGPGVALPGPWGGQPADANDWMKQYFPGG